MSLQGVADAGDAGWLSLSAFASRIGKNKSTVSRQVRDGVIPPHAVRRDGSQVMINVEAATAGRQQNMQVLLSRAPASRPAVVDLVDDAPAPVPRGAEGTLAAERAAHERIKRQRAELELKNQLGLLLDKEQVYDAFLQLGLLLRAQLENRRQILAQDLVGITDPAEIGAALERADDRALEQMASEFQKLVDMTTLQPVADAA
ncbi:hypothetical protein FHP25_35925 [Vineibacter terrae]|uniref:Terminase small subunit n=1 Tax=Vineibacter terrae TaxID=2586908 RepID=A0A5C8P8P4_9HYPH|nr:hypothetical protein [Vineibacter terrae]TXL70113.1 hypothetical protein FHP25_35925 [Vineibacter terrae]